MDTKSLRPTLRSGGLVVVNTKTEHCHTFTLSRITSRSTPLNVSLLDPARPIEAEQGAAGSVRAVPARLGVVDSSNLTQFALEGQPL